MYLIRAVAMTVEMSIHHEILTNKEKIPRSIKTTSIKDYFQTVNDGKNGYFTGANRLLFCNFGHRGTAPYTVHKSEPTQLVHDFFTVRISHRRLLIEEKWFFGKKVG